MARRFADPTGNSARRNIDAANLPDVLYLRGSTTADPLLDRIEIRMSRETSRAIYALLKVRQDDDGTVYGALKEEATDLLEQASREDRNN